MKTKEEIIQALRGSKIVMINTGNPRNAEYIQHAIDYIESMPKIHEELSTLNPNKIDEERMIGIWNNYPFSYNYGISGMSEMIKQYNSTCKDHQVLQPFPESPPDWFKRFFIDRGTEMANCWVYLKTNYGTPAKKELPSVEELGKEIADIHVPFWDERKLSRLIAQHIIDTYSLNPPKRDEFPFNLKEGSYVERITPIQALKAMEEYRSRASSELPSREAELNKYIKKFAAQDQCIGFCDGFDTVYSIASPLLASRDARIKELEEALKLSEEIVSELNRGYNRFM